MTVTSNSLIGKLYKFKPRSQWPIDAQTTLPDDKLYYIHPVIVLSATSTGMVTVVTTTSHPRLKHGINNYIPIGFPSPLLPSVPLATNRTLPKASYVCLDSRRTVTMDLLVPFMAKGRGGQFELERESKIRLVQVADEFEAGRYGRDLPPPLITWTETAATTTTAPGKKAKKRKAKQPSAPVSPVPAPPKKKKAKKAAAAALQAASTIAATTQPQATVQTQMNVQDIKTSLSGLKLAVAALEALCKKLEAGGISASPSIIVPSITPSTPASQPMMSGALNFPDIADISPSEPAKATTLPNLNAIKDQADDASALSETTRSSKRSRIEKWLGRIFKKRTGLSLFAM